MFIKGTDTIIIIARAHNRVSAYYESRPQKRTKCNNKIPFECYAHANCNNMQ